MTMPSSSVSGDPLPSPDSTSRCRQHRDESSALSVQPRVSISHEKTPGIGAFPGAGKDKRLSALRAAARHGISFLLLS